MYLYFSLRGDDPTETLKSKSLGALKQHIFSPKTALFHPFSEDFLCQFESNISTQTVETAEWRLALKWPVRFFLWNKNDLEMDGEPPSENAQIKTSTKYLSFNFSWRESIAGFFLNMYCLYYKYKCLYLYTIPVFFQESHGFSTKNPHFWPLQVDVLFEKANELSVAELEAMGGVVVVCPLKSSRCFGWVVIH